MNFLPMFSAGDIEAMKLRTIRPLIQVRDADGTLCVEYWFGHSSWCCAHHYSLLPTQQKNPLAGFKSAVGSKTT